MIGKTSSLYNTAQKGTVTVKIRKPASNSAREIRNAILRDYFGYTETDIKELDAQQPGKSFICPPGSGIEKEMTN